MILTNDEGKNEKKTAEFFAKQQKEISVSEFFEKNKHLLGFDNPTKALLIVVKEAVDNSLDACEDAGIMPEIEVKIKQKSENVFGVIVEDNGPGIVREQIPRVFGKLLYGSKFHKLRQSRGQQGLGISAAVLYAQLTTGKPTKIYSKIESKNKTHAFILHIDTAKNEPQIIQEYDVEDGREAIKDHGIRIEMEIDGRYRKAQGVDEYLKETFVSNPFATIKYSAPDGEKMTLSKAVDKLPKEPKAIKPHPYGVELGILMRMLKGSKAKTIEAFLQNDFSSVGSMSAKQITKIARIDGEKRPGELEHVETEKLLKGMQTAKLQRPPTDCLSPIGKEELERGLRKQFPDAELIFTETRRPEVYRGTPFVIEAAVVYGGETLNAYKDETIKLMRMANRVPLLYQASACATYEAITNTDWKRYGLSQSGKSVPVGPAVIVVHMCSAWVPFVSESKEAIAPYPEIVKEMKLAVQDVGRQLHAHVRKRARVQNETRRLHIFEDYMPIIAEVAGTLAEIKKKIDIKVILSKIVKKELVEEDHKAIEEFCAPKKDKPYSGSDD
ncbi:MAG: DNA topoisomerase VI subunit B [Candidatus Aenigmatarchaeota archaeon]